MDTINASRRLELSIVVLILLGAAVLRFASLTRLPAGFSNEEITAIQAAEMARQGTIASFYNTGDSTGGLGGLYPLLESLNTSVLGDGLLPYRMLSVWSGLISIALMYTLVRRLFGKYAGMCSALGLAVSLWPVLLSRSVLSEAILLPLVLAILLVLVRALHLGHVILPDTPVTSTYALLGVLLAAAAYTHWTGLLVVPLMMVFIGYLITTRQPMSRRVIGYSAFALLVTVILGIPYFTFTLRSFSLSGLHVYWALRPVNPGGLISTTLQTFASIVFAGDPTIQHNLPGYPLIGPLGGILLLVGLVAAARRWRAPNMMLILLTLIVGLFPAAWARSGPNFTNMIVALPALMALMGLGAVTVLHQVRKVGNLFADPQALIAALGTALITGIVTGVLLFRVWPNTPGIESVYHETLGHLAIFLDRTPDNLTTSICSLSQGSAEISELTLLKLMMHRKDADLRFSNCTTGLVLASGGERQRLVKTSADAISPIFFDLLGKAQPVSVEGLAPGTVVELDVRQQLADLLGKLTLSHVEWAPETIGPDPDVTLPVRMGGYLTFEGYSINSGKVYKPGDVVSIMTYWRADGNLLSDLRIFVHILRFTNTEPVLQNDILNTDSRLLRNRDVFIQAVFIPLPQDFPGGEYHVSVGAYSNSTGERLPVYDSNHERGDRLFLDQITVQESSVPEK